MIICLLWGKYLLVKCPDRRRESDDRYIHVRAASNMSCQIDKVEIAYACFTLSLNALNVELK